MSETAEQLHAKYEPNPHPRISTHKENSESKNVSKDVDYAPHPETSILITPQHQEIAKAITRLYSGSSSEKDMQVYAEKAIYGQWYGISKLFHSTTLATEILKDSPEQIIYKQRQKYQIKGAKISHKADSLVSLSLDAEGKVRYHKDQWDEKDYSHEGLGKVMKKLNGDQLTRVTRPPEGL